jgi:hypothetical protein
VAQLTVLDASILLAYFNKRDAHTETAKAILNGADGLVASVLTVAESLVARPLRADWMSNSTRSPTSKNRTDPHLGSHCARATSRRRPTAQRDIF